MQRRSSGAVCFAITLGGMLLLRAGTGLAGKAPRLEEIVVRAVPLNDTHQVNVGAFGERNIMDIPLAIQNYSATDIENSAARTLLDILKNDPSVQSASVGGGYDNLRLRGFAIDWTNTLRRDGLSLAPFQDVAHENVERIDVMKGPSGFLYGFNSPGGTINYVVERPARNDLLNLTAEVSSLQGRYAAFDASRATQNGMVGVRMNGAYQKVGDFDHGGDLERSFVSLATDWRLGERAVLQVNADAQKKSAIADPLLRADQSGRADPFDPASFVLPPHVDRRDPLTPSWNRYETDTLNMDAKLNVELGEDWYAIVQGNRSQNERAAAFQDLFDIQPDGTIGFGSIYYEPNERLTVSSLQGYIGGKFETGVLAHDIFVGASQKWYRDRRYNGAYPEISVGNILTPVDPPRIDFGEITFRQTDHVEERSVFFSDLVGLTEHWQLLSGVRYISYQSHSTDPQGVDFNRQEETTFVPSFGLIFKPVPEVTTYLSYSRGLEQGEFAPFFANNAGEQTAPIRSMQYEAGAKMDVGGRLNLGLSVFQVERQAGYVNLANDFVLDGELRHRGVELVANGRATEHLYVAASLAYLSTRLRDVTELATLNKRTEGTPQRQAAVTLEYRVPAIRGLFLGTSITHASDRPIDAQNSGFIGSYQVVDASVRYVAKAGERTVTVRLNAKNLFDKYYYSSAFFQGGLSVGRPRELIVAISTDL